jgi:hypothetical protein
MLVASTCAVYHLSAWTFSRLGGEDREGSMSSQHVYKVRPRKDHPGVDLISDALPFGRLWHCEPNAVSNAKAERKAGALTPPPPAMGAWNN